MIRVRRVITVFSTGHAEVRHVEGDLRLENRKSQIVTVKDRLIRQRVNPCL
jgi:hypothetical protein